MSFDKKPRLRRSDLEQKELLRKEYPGKNRDKESLITCVPFSPPSLRAVCLISHNDLLEMEAVGCVTAKMPDIGR